jgi:hypothetical protein
MNLQQGEKAHRAEPQLERTSYRQLNSEMALVGHWVAISREASLYCIVTGPEASRQEDKVPEAGSPFGDSPSSFAKRNLCRMPPILDHLGSIAGCVPSVYERPRYRQLLFQGLGGIAFAEATMLDLARWLCAISSPDISSLNICLCSVF